MNASGLNHAETYSIPFRSTSRNNFIDFSFYLFYVPSRTNNRALYPRRRTLNLIIQTGFVLASCQHSLGLSPD